MCLAFHTNRVFTLTRLYRIIYCTARAMYCFLSFLSWCSNVSSFDTMAIKITRNKWLEVVHHQCGWLFYKYKVINPIVQFLYTIYFYPKKILRHKKIILKIFVCLFNNNILELSTIYQKVKVYHDIKIKVYYIVYDIPVYDIDIIVSILWCQNIKYFSAEFC